MGPLFDRRRTLETTTQQTIALENRVLVRHEQETVRDMERQTQSPFFNVRQTA